MFPSFSGDGKIAFFLAHPADADPGSLEKLKYDPTATRGLPKDAFKSLTPLGSGAFKKVETGKVDTFTLALDETARNELHKVIKGGGTLHIVVAPEDDDVAATYFGAGNETEANRPRIKLVERRRNKSDFGRGIQERTLARQRRIIRMAITVMSILAEKRRVRV